jgi:hypothetical protein
MAESVLELFHNREERERLARTAFKFYQKYNMKAQADRYLDLLTTPDGSLCALPERHA